MPMPMLGRSLFSSAAVADEAQAARGNRRRLIVFGGTFLVCLAIGMAWNLLRPAEFRAVARIQLTLPSPAAAARAASSPGVAEDATAGFIAQVQRLQSRPVLEEVRQRLATGGLSLDDPAVDPVSQLQTMIAVAPVAGSSVIELVATGPRPDVLAAALNHLVAAYGEQLMAVHDASAAQRIGRTRDEVQRLEQATALRRSQLERFRLDAGLESGEREENQTVSRTRGLANALNNAIEKRATAEAQLRAVQGAVTGGKSASSAREDPTLANLEARVSQLREELRELGRLYTEQYLEMDPKARSLRTRLSELEEQLVQRRAASQQQALSRAHQELASAQANVEQLQERISAERQGLRGFSARFAQTKAMEQDLASIEGARREALERLARLEANEQALRPAVDVLQRAVAPDAAWQPDYWRDGGLVAGGSFALALLAMGFVELFNRSSQAPAATPVTVVMPSPWPSVAANGESPALAHQGQQPPATLGAGTGARLSAPPRQGLTQPEAAALLAAAKGPARLACAAWMLGLTTEELTALRQGDVDRAQPALRVPGAWPRQIELPPWFVESLPLPVDAAPDSPLLPGGDGQALGAADLQMYLSCAAVDAGLPDAARVTPDQLRYTAMAWWVREGLRFAELQTRMGHMDPQVVADLAALASDVERREPGDIPAMMPALRMPPPT